MIYLQGIEEEELSFARELFPKTRQHGRTSSEADASEPSEQPADNVDTRHPLHGALGPSNV